MPDGAPLKLCFRGLTQCSLSNVAVLGFGDSYASHSLSQETENGPRIGDLQF
jgi:hypothetical protein